MEGVKIDEIFQCLAGQVSLHVLQRSLTAIPTAIDRGSAHVGKQKNIGHGEQRRLRRQRLLGINIKRDFDFTFTCHFDQRFLIDDFSPAVIYKTGTFR